MKDVDEEELKERLFWQTTHYIKKKITENKMFCF